MDMNNSLESTLNQLVALQQQQLNTVRNIDAKQNLPSANFMSSYANYAPNYMPPMFPTTPSGYAAQDQYRAYVNNLSGNNNYGFMDTLMLNKSRYSNESRNMIVADYGSRMSNTALVGASAFTQTGVGVLANAVMPGITGMAAGLVGGAVIGGLFDIGIQQNQQQQAYNKYLLRESYRFINPSESLNDRDITGFSTTQRHEASTYLRHFGTQNRITDDETMMLLQKYTEGGLLKEVSDLKTFKEKMTQLTQSVKTSALLLNETYDSISSLMSEMQKSGINMKNFDYLAAKGKLTGAQLGISGSEALRSMYSIGVQSTQGTAYDVTMATNRGMDISLYVNELMERGRNSNDSTQKALFNLINNYGGVQNVSGMVMNTQTSFLTQGRYSDYMASIFNYDPNRKQFTVDNEMLNSVMSGRYNLNDLSTMAANKFNTWGPSGYQEWTTNKGNYIMNSLDESQMTKLVGAYVNAYNASTGQNLSSQAALKGMGLDNDASLLLGQYTDFYTQDNGSLARGTQVRARQQELINKMNANRQGFYYDLKTTWEGVKDTVGDVFAPVGDWVSDRARDFNDWFYGKTYERVELTNKNRDFSTLGLQKQGQELGFTLVEEIKKGIQDAKSKGFNLSDDLVKMFEDSIGKLPEKLQGTLSYQRTVISNKDILDPSVQGYYSSIQSEASKNYISETVLAALMKYGMSSGSAMGMTNDTISQISQKLNMNVQGLGVSGRLSAGAEYLGQLTTAYGGNQDLVLAAYMTSQSKLDSLLNQSGINISSIRQNGSWDELNSVDVQKIIDKETRQIITNVNNNVPGGGVDSGDTFAAGSKGTVSQKYYNEIIKVAKQYGLDANDLATLLSVENASGNPNAVNINADGSMDVGLGQLNTKGGIATLIQNGFMTKSGVSFTGKSISEAGELLKDPNINLEATSYIWGKAINNSQGNEFLAAAMYNGGTSRVWDLFKGLTDEEVKNLSPEQITGVLNSTHEEWAMKVANYVSKYAGIENKGALASQSATSKVNVTLDKTGKPLSQKDQQRLATFGGVLPNTDINIDKPWEIENTYKQFSTDFENYNAISSLAYPGTMPSIADTLSEDRYIKLFGNYFDVAKEGKTDFKYKMDVYSSMNKNYTAWLKEMQAYTNASDNDKTNTSWAKRSVNDRAYIMQQMQMMYTIDGGKLGLTPINPDDYMTTEDNVEYQKIKKEKGLFGIETGELYYDANATTDPTKKGSYANYIKWKMSDESITAEQAGTSVKDLMTNIDKQIESYKEQQDKAGQDAFKIINSGKIEGLFGKANSDKVKQALLSGNTSEIKKYMKELNKYDKLGMLDDDQRASMQNLLGIANRIGGTQLSSYYQTKQEIQDVASRGQDIAVVSRDIGSMLGMSKDFIEGMQKLIDEEKKDPGKKSISQYAADEQRSKNQIESFIKTMDPANLKKALEDTLSTEIVKSFETAGLITSEGKIGKDKDGKQVTKDLIDAIFGELANAAQSSGTAEEAKTQIDEAKKAGDDLTSAYDNLTDTVGSVVGDIKRDVETLKSQVKSNSNQLGYYYNGYTSYPR